MNPNACASALLLVLTAAAHAQAPLRSDFTAPPMAMLPAGGPVKGASYTIDPTHTFVNYEMGHYGTTTNRGRFSTSDGSVQIDPTGTSGKVDITMDMSSVNTGVDLLNRHVQSKDFFNVAAFPTARFQSDSIAFNGDKVTEVAGTLTLMGQARPVVLKASRFNCYMNPLIKRQVCGGDFETTVERSQWGILWGLNFGFEDKVRLLVQVEAINLKP
ncbi:YceI family protein [Variovorax sp. J22P168]|uniref:YceI family protein n=1 Tax=Variovorax jilinensis TaxID=3053513 RepID=UPI0025761504|nr:YceI family protein [Variovorax sp. J22P168]MDM0014869.1 YceI family protein [Variovorax sp. J22P168]